MNEQNEIRGDEIEDVEESRCTDCGDIMGHLTRHADGRNLCDSCEDHDADQRETYEPEPGTYAYTARFLAASGLMDGDEADRWKDEMKEADLW